MEVDNSAPPADFDEREWLRICAEIDATPLPESKHRCPAWCHRCPDLVAIVRARGGDTADPIETTMPGSCSGGWQWGLEACTCESSPRVWAGDRARKAEDLRRMARLIRLYPNEARTMLDV